MVNDENKIRCRRCGDWTSKADGATVIRGERILGVRAYCPECQ